MLNLVKLLLSTQNSLYFKIEDVIQYASLNNLLKLKMTMIMNLNEKISNKLNELLSKNYDAEKGYINAFKNVESTKLKSFFQKRAFERSSFAKELRTDILMYGQIPEKDGSFTGSMHRNWMTLKSLFSSNDEEAILEEALRGEKASLEDYNEFINEENILPPSTEKIILKQRDAIKGAINSIKVQEELVS